MSSFTDDDYTNMMLNQANANNAFNAQQADINRTWEEYMSNTSHTREVADLAAAGLNPVLSVNSGANWSSVSNATADTNATSGLASLATTYKNNVTALETSKISAAAVMAAAATTAAATQYAANVSSNATKYASDNNLRASYYSSDTSSANNTESALANNPLWAVANAITDILGDAAGLATGKDYTTKDNYVYQGRKMPNI